MTLRTRSPIRRRYTRSAVLGVVMGLIAASVAGCGAPDRSREAERLEATLRTLPGVGGADVSYVNGFDSGYTVSVEVEMPGADDHQVVAMVRRMNVEMGTDFEDFDTPVSITLGQNVNIESSSQMTPDVAAQNLAMARVAQNEVKAGWVTVSRSQERTDIEISDAEDPVGAASVVSAAIGWAPGHVEVIPNSNSAQTRWTVATPVSEAQVRQAATDIGGLATSVASVSVEGGVITELWVDAGTETEAYSTLSSVIRSIGAGRSRPLRLNWKLAPTLGNERDANGLVTVGTCGYPETVGERQPDTEFESAALALEQQVRTVYDTCRN